MLAEQSLRDGNLEAALHQLTEAVRKSPSEWKLRVFLFQLLVVEGDWERALTQLNVAADLEASTLMMAQAYREALQCEAFRADVFSGTRSPLVFGEPPEWIGLCIEALRLSASERFDEAGRLRDEAFEAAPASSGLINGERFEWIADADPRLGPILEIIVNGRYYWIPFVNVRKIDLEPPTDLRDSVWMPAHFEWANGGELVGFIPTRYPGSESSDDPLIRLARKTVWIEKSEDAYFGLGQRMLATDIGEHPLMDVRSIVLDTADDAVSSAGAADVRSDG